MDFAGAGKARRNLLPGAGRNYRFAIGTKYGWLPGFAVKPGCSQAVAASRRNSK